MRYGIEWQISTLGARTNLIKCNEILHSEWGINNTTTIRRGPFHVTFSYGENTCDNLMERINEIYHMMVDAIGAEKLSVEGYFYLNGASRSTERTYFSL